MSGMKKMGATSSQKKALSSLPGQAAEREAKAERKAAAAQERLQREEEDERKQAQIERLMAEVQRMKAEAAQRVAPEPDQEAQQRQRAATSAAAASTKAGSSCRHAWGKQPADSESDEEAAEERITAGGRRVERLWKELRKPVNLDALRHCAGKVYRPMYGIGHRCTAAARPQDVR